MPPISHDTYRASSASRELPRQVRLGDGREGGRPHVAAAAVVAPEVAARIRHQPDAVAGVAAFLGGF